jgi:hypothetical protein
MLAGLSARERLYSLPAARDKVARPGRHKSGLNGSRGREPRLNRQPILWAACNTLQKQRTRFGFSALRSGELVPIVHPHSWVRAESVGGQEPFRAASVKTGEALARKKGVRVMGLKRYSSKRGGLTASVAAAALALAAVPTAGFALDAFDSGSLHLASSDFPFTPASVDPKLARFVAERATGIARMTRFTPAGVAERGKRSLTVAVRVDDESAQAIQVRSAIATAQDQLAGTAGVRIVSARYNLGLARGYQSFAQPTVLSRKLSDAAIPDLSSFKPAPVGEAEQSRLVSRVALAHEEKPGVTPRTREALGEQSLDVATSYRLTRNLDVSAGVRYSQDRDRIAPATEQAPQDSQAFYIGTQFRF